MMDFAPANLPDFILQLASHLARIHHVNSSRLDLSFLPLRQFGLRPATAHESVEEGRIREALQSVGVLPPSNGSVLLHGDYWPGNILWRDGRLVAVIDWEDAALGDPLADLAISRLDLLLIFGLDAMNDFTRHYQSMTTIDLAHLPYWDLCAALRAAPNLAAWAAGYPRSAGPTSPSKPCERRTACSSSLLAVQ